MNIEIVKSPLSSMGHIHFTLSEFGGAQLTEFLMDWGALGVLREVEGVRAIWELNIPLIAKSSMLVEEDTEAVRHTTVVMVANHGPFVVRRIQDMSRVTPNKLEEYRTLQQRAGRINSYLSEKLTSNQLEFHRIAYRTSESEGVSVVPFMVDEYGVFHIILSRVPRCFWVEVILPELEYMAESWGYTVQHRFEPPHHRRVVLNKKGS